MSKALIKPQLVTFIFKLEAQCTNLSPGLTCRDQWTPVSPQPSLTHQFFGFQPAVHVDLAQHEVVCEVAGGGDPEPG